MVIALSAIGVGAVEEKIDLDFDVGRIARPHQLFGCLGRFLPGDDRFAAGAILVSASAGTAVHGYGSFPASAGFKSLSRIIQVHRREREATSFLE
jgi:hypothetical protein